MELKITFLLIAILSVVVTFDFTSARRSSRHRRNKHKTLLIQDGGASPPAVLPASSVSPSERSHLSNGTLHFSDKAVGRNSSEDAITSQSKRKVKKSHRLTHKRKGLGHRRRKPYRKRNKANSSLEEIDVRMGEGHHFDPKPVYGTSKRRNGKSKRHHHPKDSRHGRRKKFRNLQQTLDSIEQNPQE